MAILFIIFGVLFSMYEKARFRLSRGIALAFVNSFLVVLAYFLIKNALTYTSEVILASAELLLSGILSALILLFTGKKSFLKTEWIMNRSGLIKAAVTFAFFDIFLFLALGSGEVSSVTPVTQASLIFTLLFGALFLNERRSLWQKILGALLVLLGIILINQG